MIGVFDGDKITLEEIHRFSNDPVHVRVSNDPVDVRGTIYWDVLRLFHEVKQGIAKAQAAGGFDSIGVDTWGVDFGLIDEFGYLIENPVHYRDLRTKGMIEEAFKQISREEMYDITGIQFMELNTVFQLLFLKLQRPHVLERADKLLFMPDLFTYMLTGKKIAEYSIATTSQMVDLKTRDWSDTILDKLGIPKRLLCEITPSGTVVAPLNAGICEEFGVKPVPVIAVCGHDTQSALTAVPSAEKDFAFISSGTWSLFGTELDEPIVNEKSIRMNVTNEGGYGYSVGFLKNIIGLWLIQESRRHWNRHGEDYSYGDLERLALEAEPFQSFINPDAPEFVPHGNIPKRIRVFCKKTGQPVPQSIGEVVRCIYESLAMKYRFTFDNLMDCTGKNYPAIHVIGGGTKDKLLCQMTANACNRKVLAGPVEATVLGNVAVQLLATGEIKSIAQARKIIANSEKVKEYLPEDTAQWEQKYQKVLNIIV